VRRPDSPAHDGAPSSGSGPPTSTDRHAVEKVSAVFVAEPAKEPVMKAASPETPLELGASSVGSGASSSRDDAGRSPWKRRAAPGSAASSGDEGCSSPEKRAQLAVGDKAIWVSISRPLALSFLLGLVCLSVEFRGFLCAN
jgi:hypothetical protein